MTSQSYIHSLFSPPAVWSRVSLQTDFQVHFFLSIPVTVFHALMDSLPKCQNTLLTGPTLWVVLSSLSPDMAGAQDSKETAEEGVGRWIAGHVSAHLWAVRGCVCEGLWPDGYSSDRLSFSALDQEF